MQALTVRLLLTDAARCYKCHGPIDYNKWYTASKSYIIRYQWIFEPFLLFKRDQQHFPQYVCMRANSPRPWC
jgi:hypothetical protein